MFARYPSESSSSYYPDRAGGANTKDIFILPFLSIMLFVAVNLISPFSVVCVALIGTFSCAYFKSNSV